METATFNALPVLTHAAANAGGVSVGSYYITSDLQGQTGKRVTYYMRIAQIRDNTTVSKVMPYTKRQIPGWEQGSRVPASYVATKNDPFDRPNTYDETITITASGAWPSGAIGYDTSAKTVTQLTYQDFKAGISQQTDGYVRIYDVLTD